MMGWFVGGLILLTVIGHYTMEFIAKKKREV